MEREVEKAFEDLKDACLKASSHDKDAQAAIKASFVIAKHFYEKLIWFFTK